MPRSRFSLRRVLLVLFFAAFAWVVTLATLIVRAAYQRPAAGARADVALVLGASSHEGVPSPVFAARIDFAVDLFQDGSVGVLVITGGAGRGETIADAEAGRRHAVAKGVPTEAIFTETVSHSTKENLVEARAVMEAKKLKSCLLVSDPLHMLRATKIMRDTGIVGTPAATPYTRIHSLGEKLRFLAAEFYLYHRYLVLGR